MEGTAEERELSGLCTRVALFALWSLEFDGTRLGSGGHKRAGFYKAADGVRGGITTRIIMGQDERALIHFEIFGTRLRSLTRGPLILIVPFRRPLPADARRGGAASTP
jgi:hypothetical protein